MAVLRTTKFCASKSYLLTPIEMGSDHRYWKHRSEIKQQASKFFPSGTRYEVLMTLPHDFGRKQAVAVSRHPGLDRDELWKTMPFPSYKQVEQRLDATRGVYVLARGIV